MSQTKANRTSWLGWVISILLIGGSVWLWTERQFVVDAIQYQQFKPTEAIKEVANQSGLTDDARFTFYASRPAIESSKAFNLNCERREADSPILGCYSANRIYIYDITDKRLQGVKVVTVAHELLHAEYERLPQSERRRIDPLLQSAYEKNSNPELDARMKYYEKTEPGQALNELHSIIGTEYSDIDPQLEQYYKKYFQDRQKLVLLSKEVNETFMGLSEEADNLVNRIEKLANTININTKKYNEDIESLNRSVSGFNEKATKSGGFTTQSDFQIARAELLAESKALSDSRQQIQAFIAEYKTLLARLDSINAESASLSQSLDSMLTDVPTI